MDSPVKPANDKGKIPGQARNDEGRRKIPGQARNGMTGRVEVF